MIISNNRISSIVKENVLVKKIIKANQIVFKETLLPAEYQQVEYIEGTGSQYFDTGTKLTQNHKLEMIISHFDTSGNRKVFGSRASATASNFSVLSGPVSGIMSIVTDFFNYQNNRLAYVIDGDENMNIIISNTILKINDSEKEVTNYNEFTTPETAYLFNCNGSYPSGYKPACMRLYMFKLYENENLICNYIPCYKKSDGEVGLYDLINKVFLTNIGTGEFIKGKNI